MIDEVVGQMLTLSAVARRNLEVAAGWVSDLSEFATWSSHSPCDGLERAPGGWGIMLDDVGAGIYSLVILALLGWALKLR